MTKNTLKKLHVRFVNDRETRLNYLCFVAKNVSTGVYTRNNIPVLSVLVPGRDHAFLPRLNFPALFWRKIKSYQGEHAGQPFPKPILDLAAKLAANQSVFDYPESADKQIRAWKKIEPKFLNKIKSLGLFRKMLDKVERITILPVRFGTVGSYSHYKQGGKYHLFATIREDQPGEAVGRLIIHLLVTLSEKQFSSTENITERRNVVRFLMRQLDLEKLLKTDKSVGPSSEMLLKSEKYLHSLGFGPVKTVAWKSGEVLINHKLARNHLSACELKLFRLLYEKKGQMVTHEQIGGLLSRPDDFSEWAVTKLVSRLRTKIKKMGVNQEMVLSHRGLGYSLLV